MIPEYVATGTYLKYDPRRRFFIVNFEGTAAEADALVGTEGYLTDGGGHITIAEVDTTPYSGEDVITSFGLRSVPYVEPEE